MYDILIWNNKIFHFGIFCFGARWWSVSRDISFRNNGMFHFGIFCFWGALIFHVTYFRCLSTSNMSPILLLPTVDFVCVPLVSFGFLFLVVIEIGSLARFTCFSDVDLSWIFWSISNPFLQNNVSSLLMCSLSSLWNYLQ